MSGVVEDKSVDECVDRGQWLAALSIKELGPSSVTPFTTNPRLVFVYTHLLDRYPFPKQTYAANTK